MKTNNSTIDKVDKRLARPLKVLIPLIQRDVENAEHAGKMFYVSAGGKLIEAKEQLKHGEWGSWLRENFEFSESTARTWIGWWEAKNVRGETFSSQNEFRRKTGKMRGNVRKTDYHEPIKRILSGISAKEMTDRAVTAAKEHELERNLAMKLIKIGYDVLATKLHPDKGGSHDAMRRLNKVRARLKEAY